MPENVDAMVERVARAMMDVRAAVPASEDGKELPVLSGNPKYHDLPTDHTEGTVDDDITQEAVHRLARAAIQAIHPGLLDGTWVPAPREPAPEMLAAVRRVDWTSEEDVSWAHGYQIMLAATPPPTQRRRRGSART